MFTVEQKVDLIMRYIASTSSSDRAELKKAIIEALKPEETSSPNPHLDILLEDTIADLLCNLGVPSHLLGYRYISHAVKLVYADPTYLKQITSRLYPDVAKAFDTTYSRVERAIRHCVVVAFERGSLETIHEVFGYAIGPNTGKATNSQFISSVANAARRKMRG